MCDLYRGPLNDSQVRTSLVSICESSVLSNSHQCHIIQSPSTGCAIGFRQLVDLNSGSQLLIDYPATEIYGALSSEPLKLEISLPEFDADGFAFLYSIAFFFALITGFFAQNLNMILRLFDR